MSGRKRVRNPQSQADIVAAAERVVARKGAAHLTLDAVAKEAGISKGGLLYNFPNKESLLEAMVSSMLERADGVRDAAGESVDDGPNKALRTLLSVNPKELFDRRMGLAMLAAGAENPTLLAPLHDRLQQMREDIAASAEDPEEAYIIWMARDMLMMWSVLGVSPFTEGESCTLCRRLAELAETGFNGR